MDRFNELIKQMLYAGWSRGEIAKKLGVTRNSVVGRVHRMKLAGLLPGFEDNRPSEPTPKQRVERKRERKRRIAAEGARKVERRAPPKVVSEVPPEWAKITIEVKSDRIKVGKFLCDLPDGRACRFPVGRYKGQHTFCGKPGLSSARPYCEEHKPLVWIKATGQRPRQKFKQTGFNTFVYGSE